jgi:hypothetical protein
MPYRLRIEKLQEQIDRLIRKTDAHGVHFSCIEDWIGEHDRKHYERTVVENGIRDHLVFYIKNPLDRSKHLLVRVTLDVQNAEAERSTC